MNMNFQGEEEGPAPANGQGGRKFEGNCNHCGKKGHKAKDCFKRKREERGRKAPEAAHAAALAEPNAGGDDAGQVAEAVRVDDAVYTTVDYVNKIEPVLAAKLSKQAQNRSTLLLVLDGASTTGIVQDGRHCTNIKEVDVRVKVSGSGKPTILQCRKEGTLTCVQEVDGRRCEFSIRVRTIPGFGCDILRECFSSLNAT